jgi:hypothetical protein
MSSANLYLGVILVIAVIIIAFFAVRSWKKHRSGVSRFTYATPAVPRIREAVEDLFVALRHFVDLGRKFESVSLHACTPYNLEMAAPHGRLADVGKGVAPLVAVMDRTVGALAGIPPTYANYLGLYRGMSSTDATLQDAAGAYVAAGHRALQDVAAGAPDCDGSLTERGNLLIQMGEQVGLVTRAVHRLGVTLDLE